MGQVVTDVQIVNGQIRVFFGPCCYKDLGDITSLQSTKDRTQEVPQSMQPDQPGIDAACQKAYALTSHLFTMTELVIQDVLSGGIPFYPFNTLKSAYPNVSFDIVELFKFTSAKLVLEAMNFGFLTDFGDAMTRQYICTLASQFDDSWTISNSEFATMKSIAKSLFGERGEMLVWMIEAVGVGDWGELALSAAGIGEVYDCSCPEEGGLGFDETAAGWYLSDWSEELGINTPSGNDFVWECYVGQEAMHDVYGWALVVVQHGTGNFSTAGDHDGCSEWSGVQIPKGGTVYLTTPGIIQMFCNSTVYAEIKSENPALPMVHQGAQDASSTNWPQLANDPRINAGEQMSWHWRNDWNAACNVTFRVALLHNTDSPSHSA